MFTGLVEEVGTLAGIRRGRDSAVISVRARRVLEGLRIGDSVAVDGVCLTVTDIARDGFTADAMHETLRRSTLGAARPGRRVDLETGTVAARTRDANAVWLTVDAPPAVTRYVVEKGSIAIDGVSLTVAALTPAGFKVSVIPHTLEQTALADRRPGDAVNLEADVIGKYVERLLVRAGGDAAPEGDTDRAPAAGPPSGITRDFLISNGF